MKKEYKEIFKKGSTTFFYSSLFFPARARAEVATLYAFVRIADDFVDAVPQQAEAFLKFKNDYLLAKDNKPLTLDKFSGIIYDFIELSKKYNFQDSWVEAFLNSMEADLTKKFYSSIEETEEYIYGSAEVIGLMMSRIMQLDPRYDVEAQALGYAFQYINFIRDIYEDEMLGRSYLPSIRYESFGLMDIKKTTVQENKNAFRGFLKKEIEHFQYLLNLAQPAIPHMPLRYRLPILVAIEAYKYTGRVIASDPMVVFDRKVKPSKVFILFKFIQIACQQIIFKKA